MANRHLSRSVILQTLFECDFRGFTDEKQIHDMLLRNTEEFAPGLDDADFIEALTFHVLRKKAIIDEIIQKAA